jgi:hypothetical protein
VLLVLIAVALTVSHLGHVDTLDLTTGARIGGAAAGVAIGVVAALMGVAGSGESNIRQWIIENDLFDESSPCRPTCSTTPASAPRRKP